MPLNLYIDSCILVAYHNELDKDNKHQLTIDCLENIKNDRKISLVTSDFTFTEFVNVLQRKENITEAEIFKNLSNMMRQKKIGSKYSFQMIDVEGNEENFEFGDFFVGLQKILLETKAHLADAIHAQIMMNNKIKHILTFDTNGFDIDGIKAIHPAEIESFQNRTVPFGGKIYFKHQKKK